MDNLSPLFYSTVPVIATNDIEKSLWYYENILGFSFDFKYGEPPVYGGVKSENAEIYFTLDPSIIDLFKEKNLHPEIFIWVTNANRCFDRHLTNGADIVEPVSDRPWGARQYVVRDINGYHLKFAQALQASSTVH